MTTTDVYQFGELKARARLFEPMPLEYLAPPRLPRARNVAQLVDLTIADSFPASDPPSWTASVAMPAPIPIGRAEAYEEKKAA